MRRLAVIALVVAAALLRPSGVAGQITIPTGSTTTVPPTTTAPVSLVDDHVLVVQAASPGTMALTDEPGAPYSGPVLRCAYFDLIIGGVDIIDIIPVTPTIGETYLWYCWEPGNHPYLEPYSPTYPIVVVFSPVVDPPGEVITTPDTARFAVDSIEFEAPVIATAPAADHVVGVPSWLAVTNQLDYAPVSAQAGPVWATVRPEFRDVTWDLGNGDEVVCVADATNVFDPEGGDGQTTECAYTYESSGAEPFPGSATVTWTIWQQTDRDPTGWQVWGSVSLTTAVGFAVTELEAAIN